MNPSPPRDPLPLRFHLHRTQLQTQHAWIDSQLARLAACLAAETTRLAALQAQQSAVEVAIAHTLLGSNR